MGLLKFTDRGIYCEAAKVYIDPWKPVDFAIITHAHADHSRYGNKHYLCHHLSKPIIQHRLGKGISINSKGYGEVFTINGVKFSLYPAGHIIGSSQVKVEHQGEVWVVSGDYKIENDGISTPFEAIKCDVFITECTFGLPVFKWPDQKDTFEAINKWWTSNAAEGKTSLVSAYSLGKAQRVLKGIDSQIGKIYVHGAIYNMQEVITSLGFDFPKVEYIDGSQSKKDFEGSLVIAPPGALDSQWQKKLGPISTAMTSGWMALRGTRRRGSLDRGFVMSDHADWDGLNKAIEATGCEKVITTHGYTSIFTKWLNEKGLEATIESTAFEGENMDTANTKES